MTAMPLERTLTTALVLGGALASLNACGSSTKTVSVSGPPTQTQSSAAHPSKTTAKRATTPTSPPAPAPRSSGTTGARAAPEPEFTQQEHRSAGLSAAAAVVRAHGFTPVNASDYHPGQALTLLIGMRSGSGDGHGQQAFFFVNGRYIGTDAIAPSAALNVVSQNDTEVTLAYPLYRAADPLCCPSGGHTRVRFQLNNGKLSALDPIPPVSSRRGFSRQ
jgi:hypothetical protein